MKKRLSPAELKPLLKALSSTAGVIIGGQAVNLWAEHYQEHTPLWAGLGPFTSFDLNVLGSRNDVLECGKLLGGEIFFPRSGKNTANSGKVVAELHGQQIEIDFLHSPNGLAPAEVFELSRVIHFQEIPLRLLHPLHCLESKTVARISDLLEIENWLKSLNSSSVPKKT